jgi:hypothetical protein
MRLSIALTTLALLCSPAAFSQDRSPPSSTEAPSTSTQQTPPSSGSNAGTSNIGAIFDQLNVSHTGKMTKEEAQAHPTVAANFDKADANHDGVLTKDEFLTAFKPQ